MAQNRHFARKNPLRSSQNAAGLKLVFQERDMGQAENGEWKVSQSRQPCVVVAGERTAVPGTAPRNERTIVKMADAPELSLRGAKRREIGRASCRERV